MPRRASLGLGRRSVMAWFVSMAAVGCVSRGTYDGAMRDLAEAREEATEHFHEAEMLRADEKRFEAEAQKCRGAEADLKGANAQLTHQVEDLMLLNAEFSERLKGAGQNVEQLATERGSLRQALDATRAELADWRKQQQAIAVRTAQQHEIATALRALVDAKRIDIGVRLGRVVVTIPSDDVFDPGKTNVKATGRPTLTQIAGALRSTSGRTFRVAAHVDVPRPSQGFSTNWQLTAARAMSVARELMAAGLPQDRVSIVAQAEYDPVDSNETESGRARNRRIEIVLAPLPEELVQPGTGARAPAAATPNAKP